MKHLKIFPKTFLYTLGLMLFVVAIAHILIYFLMPQATIDAVLKDNIVSDSFSLQANFVPTKFVIQAIQKALPISLFCCFLLSIGCSLLFSKGITRSIQHISATTEQMTQLDKSISCSIHSQDEIGALGKNINHLYDSLLSTIECLELEKKRVREMEQSKSDFLRAASHELKTPVTALNAILENMILGIGKYKDYDTYLPECKELVENLSIMIHEILETSKVGLFMESEPSIEFDLGDWLTALCKPYQLIAKANGIKFTIDVSHDFLVSLPPRAFNKVVSNILANAITYTEKGNQVTVLLQQHCIIIENECSQIPTEELQRLFEPFYRPDFSRSRESGGNGLGLYIVNTLLTSMNISYSFVPMELPQGMRFIIKLP